MHLITLHLIPHMRQQHIEFRLIPTTQPRKHSERVAVDGALNKLVAEVLANLLELLVLGPGADGADLLVDHDVLEAGAGEEAGKFGEDIEDAAVAVGYAVEFGLCVTEEENGG